MKRTTCGRWVHAACELWVPETALDVERGLVNGLQFIHKVRSAQVILCICSCLCLPITATRLSILTHSCTCHAEPPPAFNIFAHRPFRMTERKCWHLIVAPFACTGALPAGVHAVRAGAWRMHTVRGQQAVLLGLPPALRTQGRPAHGVPLSCAFMTWNTDLACLEVALCKA